MKKPGIIATGETIKVNFHFVESDYVMNSAN